MTEQGPNLSAELWYETWSRVIARAWQDASFRDALVDEPPDRVLRILKGAGFVPADTPANWPNLTVKAIPHGTEIGQAQYCEKNAFSCINGWASHLPDIGGKASVVLPSRPAREQNHAQALADYLLWGAYMPFRSNYGRVYDAARTAYPIGSESSSDAADCDGLWLTCFPVLIALAWSENGINRHRLIQPDVSPALRTKRLDAVFAEVGYPRPIGLEIEFVEPFNERGERIDIVEETDEGVVWNVEALRPTLTMHLPPPPTVPFRAAALSHYRGTGKSQLFTT